VTNPVAGRIVSLRAQVTDNSGNTLDQAIYHASMATEDRRVPPGRMDSVPAGRRSGRRG